MAKTKLDQAMVGMAKAVATAKGDAAEAKKLAGDVTVSATVNEKGILSLNGKESEIHLITPKTVSEEVGKALGSADTPSRLLAAQAQFESAQVASAVKIALEKGKVYIEDALPEKIRDKVMSGYYRDTSTKVQNEVASVKLEITRAIQKLYDELPSNVFITSRGGYFPITKNIGYKPEYFGKDGRNLAVGGVTLPVNGQQPCIAFHHSIFNVFDFSQAEFSVQEMGLSAFHLCGKSEGNVIFHGGKITTRAYELFGYKSGEADADKRWIPHIDGWTKEAPNVGTGMSLKGYPVAGANTASYAHDFARYMENSCDSSGVRQPDGYNLEKIKELFFLESKQIVNSAGGYFNENGESAFPQADGTTASTWGLWRGGQWWSRGYGWRIYDCRNTEIKNFHVTGFTGGAIAAGLHGSPAGEDIQPGDVEGALAKGCVAINTRITGGYYNHNYTCGVEAIRVIGYELTGIFAPDSVIGHPDANLEHVRGWNNSIISLDPGYQSCTSRYLPMDNIYIHANTFGLGKRKVIDIHTGNNVKIYNNSGKAMYYGISTVIEEIFASKDGRVGKIADPQSFYFQDSNIEIVGNTIMSGHIGIHPINGAPGVLFRRSKNMWWLRCRQLIADNTVYAPRGLISNYGHNHFIIERNQFTFALPFGQFFGMHQVSGIKVTDGGSGYTSEPEVKITGGGEGAFGATAQAKIKDGKVVEIIVRRDGSRYTEIPTVTITGGGGSGATATATINTQTYGMLIGAESKYGTMLATQVRENYVQNSPDGNYARQIVFGRMRASTIEGNHCDVTPFRSPEKAKLPVGNPFVSDSIVYRDGLLSSAFYNGDFDTCSVGDNFIHNQLIDTVHVWTGKTINSNVHKKYEPTSYAEVVMDEKVKALEAAVDKLKEQLKTTSATTSQTASPPKAEGGEQSSATTPAESPKTEGGEQAATTQPAQPPKTEEGGQPATPQPTTPSESATEEPAAKSATSITFTFDGLEATAAEAIGSNNVAKLKSVNNSERAGEPEGWAGAFGEDSGHKIMRSLVAGEGKGIRFIESDGLTSDGSTDSAIIIPFKQSAGGTAGSGFTAIVLKGRSVVSNGLISTNEETGFKLRYFEGTTINGKPISTTTVYPYDKWHVAVIPVLAGTDKAFDKIRIGMNHAGNVGRNVIVGAGIEFIQGDISKVEERVTALMSEYGIS